MKNLKWIIIGTSVIIIFTISGICIYAVVRSFWHESNLQNFLREFIPESGDPYLSEVINAEDGGIVELLDDTRLEIPPGAFDNDVIVSISKTTESLKINDEFQGEAIIREINVDNASIIKPITLTFKYDDLINKDMLSPDAVYIARWDGNQWEYLGGDVNPTENTISIEIDHLSVFGVFSLPSLDSLFESLESLIDSCFPSKLDPELTQIVEQIIEANSKDGLSRDVKVESHENLGTLYANKGKIIVDIVFFDRASNWLPTHSNHHLLEPMLAHELSHIENSTTDIEVISELLIEASNKISKSDFMYEMRAYLSRLKIAILEQDCYAAYTSFFKLVSDIPGLFMLQLIDDDTCAKYQQMELNADVNGVLWASQKNNELISSALVFTHWLYEGGDKTSCTHPSGVDRVNNIFSNIDIGDVGGVYGRVTISNNTTAITEADISELIITVDDSIYEKTDAQGRFLFTGLSSGQHTLTVSLAGYKPISQILDIPYQKLVEMNLSLEREIEVDFPIVNIGFPKSIYVRYDPSKWDVIEMGSPYQTEAGESVSALHLKDFPVCSIHNNWGRTLSPDYEKNITEKVIGNLDYQLETWNDPTGKPYLTVYQYSPIEWIVRIELLIGSEPDICIQDAEEVLALSSDLIVNIEDPHLTEGQIAYIEKGLNSTSLKLMNSDGSEVETLLMSSLDDITWSPNGKEIAYTELINQQENRWLIKTLDLSSKEIRIIVPPERSQVFTSDVRFLYYGNPRYTPDGDALYYHARDRPKDNWLKRFDTISGQKVTVFSSTVLYTFDVSPTSEYFVVSNIYPSMDCSDYLQGHCEFPAMDIYNKSGQLIKVLFKSQSGSDYWSPIWSPDGETIVFSSSMNSNRPHLWIVSEDESIQTQVTFENNFIDSEPNWSPDGNWIVFSRRAIDEQNSDIWIVSNDGEILLNLTNTPDMSEENPIWRP